MGRDQLLYALEWRPSYARGFEASLNVTSLEDKDQRGSCIFYITGKLAHQYAQNTTFGLFAAASLFRLTGWFHIHLLLFI